MTQEYFPDFLLTDAQTVRGLSLQECVDRAVALIRLHEPEDGYYLAFSGGKDSCAVNALTEMAGVKFEKWYNNTTIDPPELVRFIKRVHPDAKWNNPKLGNMLYQVGEINKTPPTRSGRWCCELYKEHGGDGRTKIFGIRAAESPDRAHNWREIGTDRFGSPAVAPIVHWSTERLWEFIHAYKVPYCSLYDEGFTRLGCIGCFLATKSNQDREFARWPKYEQAWKKAIIRNWEKWKDVPNSKTGEPRYHAKFKTGEDFWQWWRNGIAPKDPNYEDCQSAIMWTND